MADSGADRSSHRDRTSSAAVAAPADVGTTKGATGVGDDGWEPVWTTSFDADDRAGMAAFFARHGFVVVHGVLPSPRVETTVDEIWESRTLLGSCPDIDRDDPSTWDDDNWPVVDNNRGFLDAGDDTVLREAWRNRQDPRVVGVFQHLLETEALWVKVDRFGVLRPSGLNPAWRTDEGWLHWDQDPLTEPGFRRVQGLIALTDQTPTRGGFECVPGFHTRFDEWAEATKAKAAGAAGTTGGDDGEGGAGGAAAGVRMGSGGGMVSVRRGPIPVPTDDPMHAEVKVVTMRAGSLLVWDSRLPHANFPNDGKQWRMVQYVTYSSAAAADRDDALRIQARATASARNAFSFGGAGAAGGGFGAGLRAAAASAGDSDDGDDTGSDEGPGFPELLTPLGRRLAGLDLWPVHEAHGAAEAAGASASSR